MITKTTMVVIFDIQHSYLLTLSFLSSKRPKSASNKSSSCRFSFSATKNANTTAAEYVTLGLFFCILVFSLLGKFEPHSDTDFLVF